MKQLFTKMFAGCAFLFMMIAVSPVFGQTGVLNPNDVVVTYNGSNATQPPPGQIKDWVRTRAVSWNTDDYKCYIYQGLVFRLKFPKTYQHGVNDGKTYPLYIFFHGLGEAGTIYNNEKQLVHGGQTHLNAVNNGTFDGYLMYPQNEFGFFGASQYSIIKTLIENYFVPQIKVDINRILVDGLSGGGTSTWDFTKTYPQLVAGCLPISAANTNNISTANLNIFKFIPIWHFQGGRDPNPAPAVSHAWGDALLSVGTNYRYTEYPNRGHSCWNDAWAEPDFYPYMLRQHKANPVPLFGKYQFCEGEPVNVTLGVSAGFTAYEWRKDGVTIPGATSNQYTVTSYGVYACRIRRGTVWSPWSPQPIDVKIKAPTITPPIQLGNGTSNVIPSPSSNSVLLELPVGYETYSWQKVGSPTVIGTSNTIEVNTPGEYIVKVTEKFGCISEFSPPYKVISADGPDKPDVVTNLVASPFSRTQIKLDWMNNPYPVFNETGFEIYQATTSGGPYILVGLTGADANTFTVSNLETGKKYYYVIRSYNNSGASALSTEASGNTVADDEAPSSPNNFRITSSNSNSVSLAWDASTDNIGVDKYDIYINGQKSYITSGTTWVVYNLSADVSYTFYAVARDSVGNLSAPSNQITSQNTVSGLRYKYYHGSWTQLPDFNTLASVKNGISTSGFSLSPRTQNSDFGFLWEGFINIPTDGTYTFRTASEDGSKLWLGEYNNAAVPLVNNDGDRSSTITVTGTPITLTKGIYPISVAFFNRTGSESLTVSWRTPTSGTSYATIPSSSFLLSNNPPAPAAPSNLVATSGGINKINLTWVDKSNNETGFEIARSTNPASVYTIIKIAPANATSYTDSIGVLPGTTYYYRVRAIHASGQSDYTQNFAEAKWLFNGTYADAGVLNKVITPVGSPTFNSGDKVEGSHSLSLSGASGNYVAISNSGSFLQESYTQRTVSFWMKSNSNTGNRMVLDIGGSDDGLALRLNSSTLIAGIASNSNRSTITATYNNSNWNHIALVYAGNTLKLYINGTEAAANNALSFSSIGTTSNAAAIGAYVSSNAFNSTSGYTTFNGLIDNFAIYNRAFAPEMIAALMNNTLSPSNATTGNLPALPADPSGLEATSTATSAINISWIDAANNEDKYEVYRSNNNASNYVLIATLGANAVSYQDTGLFANSIFYYKVRAVNVGGVSSYSNEDSAITKNNIPQVAAIATQWMQYGTELQLNIQASDIDNGSLTLSTLNLPAFASFVQNGNGGVITFAPALSDLGAYSDITIVATDVHNAAGTASFVLNVTNNASPVIAPVTGITLSEQQTGQVDIAATDENGADILSWTFTGLPAFATPVVNGGNVAISLAPGLADHGTYIVKAKVADGNNGYDSANFTITVNNVNPNKKIYINFSDGLYQAGAPWNSPNNQPAFNNTYNALKDQTGIATPIGFKITSPWQNLGNGSNNLGANTGNNSGVYPDAVIRSAYWTDATSVQTIRFFGLDPNSKYSFTMFGSRGSVSDNRTTLYTIKGISVSLNAASNTQNTVNINQLVPETDSSLTLSLAKGAGSSFGYLNALIIESLYEDGTAPAKPRELAATLGASSANLTWLDAAYNETGYEIYRSLSASGPFVLLNAGGTNPSVEQYNDSAVAGGKTYYYAIRAINAYGNSPYSDTISISTPNVIPVLNSLGNIQMKTQQTLDVNITVSDPEDVIAITATGLPAFATLTDNGNATGVIHLAPGSTLGDFNITVIATDSKNASATSTFKVSVTDKDITSYYVNFNQPISTVGAPWNNFNSAAFAGKTLANIKDENLNVSDISVTLVTAWEGDNELGAITGTNSGIFPDAVMKTAYYESGTTPRTVRVSGLSTAANVKYNLVFFASRAAGDNRTTVYSVGANSVSLNAANNTTNTVQINGLSADASGNIDFTAVKGAGSSFAYINALVIQSYIDNGNVIAPANLAVAAKSKTSIQLNWADKSGNEDGFEIYRSTSAAGTFSLITTTAPNATTFTNQGLQSNQVYYYKVRAKKGAIFSDYTNTEGISTYTFSVLVNFNVSNNASSPWNNLASAPEQDRIYTNFRNDLANSTGIGMKVTQNFSGDNPSGMNTGNNSGVVPDNVMRSSWWLDYGISGELKITGLNHNWAYTFVFFASRNGDGDRTTVYTINGKSVSLNASFNTTQTVQLENVHPDENGEVTIGVSLGQYAQFGYINGMMIHGYEIQESSEGGGSGGGTQMLRTILPPAALGQGNTSLVDANVGADQQAAGGLISKLTAFPNPFTSQLTVAATFAQAQPRVTVRIADMMGRLIYHQQFSNVPAGNWNQQLNLDKIATRRGVYLLQVIGSDGKKPAVFKLLKSN